MTWVNPNYIREVRPDGGITYRQRDHIKRDIFDKPPCVCGCEAAEHHAWTGPCNGGCGCSYYLADNGIEPVTIIPPTDTYNGIYARRQWTA